MKLNPPAAQAATPTLEPRDPETGLRDFEAELRLGCLKAALELRTPASPAADVLVLADRFYAWTKGQASKH